MTHPSLPHPPLPRQPRRFTSQPHRLLLQIPLRAVSRNSFRRSIKEAPRPKRRFAPNLNLPAMPVQSRTPLAASPSSSRRSVLPRQNRPWSQLQKLLTLHPLPPIPIQLRPAAALPSSFAPSTRAPTPNRPLRLPSAHPPPWQPHRERESRVRPAGLKLHPIFGAIEGNPPPSAAENPPQAWGQVPQSQSAPIVPPPYAPPVSEAPRSEGSNLTQLLRNLDQSGSVESLLHPLPKNPTPSPRSTESGNPQSIRLNGCNPHLPRQALASLP